MRPQISCPSRAPPPLQRAHTRRVRAVPAAAHHGPIESRSCAVPTSQILGTTPVLAVLTSTAPVLATPAAVAARDDEDDVGLVGAAAVAFSFALALALSAALAISVSVVAVVVVAVVVVAAISAAVGSGDGKRWGGGCGCGDEGALEVCGLVVGSCLARGGRGWGRGVLTAERRLRAWVLGVLKPAAAVVAAARAAVRAGRRDGACIMSVFKYVQSVFMGAMERKCTRSEKGGRLSRQRVTKWA